MEILCSRLVLPRRTRPGKVRASRSGREKSLTSGGWRRRLLRGRLDFAPAAAGEGFVLADHGGGLLCLLLLVGHLVEVGVDAALCEQFIVRADLGDTALV